MKAFWFSAIALLLLCGVIIWNGIYISEVSDDMLYHIDKISSSDDTDSLDALVQKWNNCSLIVSISVPHKESDELEKNLDILKVKMSDASSSGLDESVALVRRAIEEIKIHGTVSIDNVF